MTSSTEERRAARARSRGAPRRGRAPRPGSAWRARCAGRRSAPATRKARAISSVVSPPSRRRVSATRASVESTGWQAVNTRRRRSSPTSSSSGRRRAPGRAASCRASSSRPSSSCLRSMQRARGAGGRWRDASRWPSARRPGCPGCPTPATARGPPTRASCASSSARPTSRTMRARPAMSLADSMRQTASMVRWMSVAVTATDHSIESARARGARLGRGGQPSRCDLLGDEHDEPRDPPGEERGHHDPDREVRQGVDPLALRRPKLYSGAAKMLRAARDGEQDRRAPRCPGTSSHLHEHQWAGSAR